MNEYDQRQYNRMIQVVRLAQPRLSSLGRTINDLEALLGQITDRDETWIEEVQNEWWELEIEYAMTLSKGDTELDQPAKLKVTEALRNLQSLIQRKIEVSV